MLPLSCPDAPVNIEKHLFGKLRDGREVFAWTLSNDQSMSVTILEFGATLNRINVPDRSGLVENVILSYPSLRQYERCPYYLGSTVGRLAGRLGRGRFSLNGRDYQLDINDEYGHHLHGGRYGWHKQLWSSHSAVQQDDTVSLVLEYTCCERAGGYPGTVDAQLKFSLNQHNGFSIEYAAETDKPTPINLTNHSYFNLSGSGNSVLQHELLVSSDSVLETDHTGLPSGRLLPTELSPLDFSNAERLGERMFDKHTLLKPDGGYDHTYMLNAADYAARLYAPESGRTLTVITDQPALNLYTGNYLGQDNNNDCSHPQYSGVCLETQFPPDSLNQPEFPTIIYTPKRPYQQTTDYLFSV